MRQDENPLGEENIKAVKHTFHSWRWILYALISIIVMTGFLFWWAEVTAVDCISVLDRVTEQHADGDVTVYSLDLSDIEMSDRYSLHFKSYGNAVRILADGREIYNYGFDYMQRHQDIGRIYVSAFLPDQCESVEITLAASDANASPEIAKLELCTLADTGRYYLSNDTLGFPMALIFLVLGAVSLIIGIAIGRRNERYILMYFAGILLCMAVELSDTGGHYLVFFRNQHIWNIIFYFASYILPVAAPCYGYAMMGSQFPKEKRKIVYPGIVICSLYGIIAAVLSLTTRLRFCDFAFWSPINITVSIAFGSYAMVYSLRHGIVKQKTFLIVSVGTLIWGILAIVLLMNRNATIGSNSVTPMDMESMEAIFLLGALGTAMLRVFYQKMREIQEQQMKTLQLENEMLTMQYKVFVSQMQPHFLYNALSSIRQIVYENPDYAADLIRDFTVHLRATIRALSNDKLIPFSEELKNIKAYVKIEQMRFGEKLKVNYEVETDEFEIIPLSIQPLVENAIRHGIYHRGDQGGCITLRTSENDDGLLIEVIDDGVGFDPEQVFRQVEEGKRDSTGLKSLLFRLEEIMHAKVEIHSVIGEGTRIMIFIPEQEEV